MCTCAYIHIYIYIYGATLQTTILNQYRDCTDLVCLPLAEHTDSVLQTTPPGHTESVGHTKFSTCTKFRLSTVFSTAGSFGGVKNHNKGGCKRLFTFVCVCPRLLAFACVFASAFACVCPRLSAFACVCSHLLAPPFVAPPSA